MQQHIDLLSFGETAAAAAAWRMLMLFVLALVVSSDFAGYLRAQDAPVAGQALAYGTRADAVRACLTETC